MNESIKLLVGETAKHVVAVLMTNDVRAGTIARRKSLILIL